MMDQEQTRDPLLNKETVSELGTESSTDTEFGGERREPRSLEEELAHMEETGLVYTPALLRKVAKYFDR